MNMTNQVGYISRNEPGLEYDRTQLGVTIYENGVTVEARSFDRRQPSSYELCNLSWKLWDEMVQFISSVREKGYHGDVHTGESEPRTYPTDTGVPTRGGKRPLQG